MPRDWLHLIASFKELELKCGSGEYCDSLDALSLSKQTCDGKVHEEDGGVGEMEPHYYSSDSRPRLTGLERLVYHLNNLLNESYISQQAVLSILNDDCAQFSSELSSSSFSTSPTSKIVTSLDISNWDKLPDAAYDDDKIEKTISNSDSRIGGSFSDSIGGSSSRIESSSRQSKRRMQDVHDKAVELLDTKLCAFEVIVRCEHIYKSLLIQQVNNKGVSRASTRVFAVVEPAMIVDTCCCGFIFI